ncbi:TerC family protein, partial [Nocardioides sp. NPDC059952]
ERLVYLSYGLAILLGFIGLKLVFHALHENELPFINGGEHVEWAPEVSIEVSLSVIIGILAITTILSLLKSRSMTAKERDDATGPRSM